MSDATTLFEQASASVEKGDLITARSQMKHLITHFPDSAEATAARYGLMAMSLKGAPTRVLDLDIGFWSMVTLFVKAAFAAIPAAIVIAVIWLAIGVLLAGIGLSV